MSEIDHIEFSDLRDADNVVVTNNLNAELHRVSDPQRIAPLVDFLVDRQDGWYVPEGGPRIMKLRINFSADGTSTGSVGFGRKYLIAQRRGGFYQRDAEPGDREKLLDLLGMEDPE